MTDTPTKETDLQHLPVLAGLIGSVCLVAWLGFVLGSSDVLAVLVAAFVLYARKPLEPPA